MLLLTDRGVPKELEEVTQVDAGDLQLGLRVRILKLWTIPAQVLLEAGDAALLPWVPLTDWKEADLRLAVDRLKASHDEELQTRMKVLYGLRYLSGEVIESMLTEEILEQSSYYQKILKKGMEKGIEEGLQAGREQGERNALLRILTLKFGQLTAETEARIGQATTGEIADWTAHALTASTIEEVMR